ncbi:Putative uncharacterized protein [Taphrina deformans PYCC 5710]|uniref:AB hydrolase-1 domain-containing protein n=1 Tax=Taphrina deformans (strain PYCC 5710 / ATCC 11124 / CBS 356.35 / IMI 108563 / JCM 9778 / NBRC 8474) TaxID=1097556 RepID=R4XAV4_TAPDE|nr:Putative uncharacterized protein [Taphrina deformans PYCC 5710]|eukprot:CCG82994.1 Putative uncharacterized protein [Taphrina deformans PYCC 5710]
MPLEATCESNDGVKIHYKYSPNLTADACLVLIHGFSGSSDCFKKNIPTLAQRYSVIAYDLRGHGKSGKSVHGAHVNRLAADLRDLVSHLKSFLPHSQKLIGIGCSIGAAVLWSYTELFTCADFDRFVFVDQAPLQNYAADGSWGPDKGNYGCHDAASAAYNQAALTMNFDEANKGLVASCLGYRFSPLEEDQVSASEAEEDEKFFIAIAEQCDPQWLSKLMADHTQYDHRETIRHRINIPCLVLAGKRSGCFPTKGTLETAKLINERHRETALTIEFESGHWLFYEEPERFNQAILTFTQYG